MSDKVWMKPPDGGKPQEVEATAAVLTPLLVLGWQQCEAPAAPAAKPVKGGE